MSIDLKAAAQVGLLAGKLDDITAVNAKMMDRQWVLELIVQMEKTKRALSTLHEIPDYQIREQFAIAGILR